MSHQGADAQQAAMEMLVNLSHAPHDGEKLHPDRLRAICAVGHDREAFAAQIAPQGQSEALVIPKRSAEPVLAKPVPGEPVALLQNAFALVIDQHGEALRALAEVESAEKATQDPSYALLLACRQWWEGHRPIAFSIDDHLENPGINTSGEGEKLIAKLVAAAITDGMIGRGEEYDDSK